MNLKFDHYGVPTTEDREDAGYHPVLHLHYSSSINSLFRIEYLKFDEDCIFSEEITSVRHLAFVVDSIDDAIAELGCRVLQPKIQVSPTLTISYVKIEDVVVELMERG